jgi:hypothetical protein
MIQPFQISAHPDHAHGIRWGAHINEKRGGADLERKLPDSSELRNIYEFSGSNHRMPMWQNPMVATWTPRKMLSANEF